MRRWMAALVGLLAVGAIGGAGYMGTIGARPGETPVVQKPPTVAVTRGDVQQTVTAPGRLVGARQMLLSMQSAGRLAELNVRPGEVVKAGDILARLDRRDLNERAAQAQADLDVAQAKLAKLQAGPTAVEVAAAQADVATAQHRLSQLTAGPAAGDLASARAEVQAARARLDKARSGPDAATLQAARFALETAKNSLWSQQVARDAACGGPNKVMCDQGQAAVGNADAAVRKAEADLARLESPERSASAATDLKLAELDLQKAQARLAQVAAPSAESELHAARLGLERAQAALAQLTAGPPAADLAQAQASLRAAELALERANTALAAADLAAPFDGIVIEVKANPGEMIVASAGLLLIADTSSVEVLATVIEEDLPLVKTGQAVELFFDAHPDAAINGRLARVVPERAAGDRASFPVYISVDANAANLLPGMTVDASIIVERRAGVLRLPRATVRAGAEGGAQVQVWAGDHLEQRAIKVGLRGDVYVEVLEGLREGEQVVAA